MAKHSNSFRFPYNLIPSFVQLVSNSGKRKTYMKNWLTYRLRSTVFVFFSVSNWTIHENQHQSFHFLSLFYAHKTQTTINFRNDWKKHDVHFTQSEKKNTNNESKRYYRSYNELKCCSSAKLLRASFPSGRVFFRSNIQI